MIFFCVVYFMYVLGGSFIDAAWWFICVFFVYTLYSFSVFIFCWLFSSFLVISTLVSLVFYVLLTSLHLYFYSTVSTMMLWVLYFYSWCFYICRFCKLFLCFCCKCFSLVYYVPAVAVFDASAVIWWLLIFYVRWYFCFLFALKSSCWWG